MQLSEIYFTFTLFCVSLAKEDQNGVIFLNEYLKILPNKLGFC